MVAEQVAPATGGTRRSVLRRRDYRLLFLSFTTSKLGDFLYLVALVAYVYAETGSAAWVSAAALSRFVPYTLLSPVAGVIADRYERRRVMAAGDAIQLVAMSVLALTARTMADAEAVYSVAAEADAAAAAMTTAGGPCSTAVSASTDIATSWIASPAAMTRRRSYRSAITPATGESNV